MLIHAGTQTQVDIFFCFLFLIFCNFQVPKADMPGLCRVAHNTTRPDAHPYLRPQKWSSQNESQACFRSHGYFCKEVVYQQLR